MRLKTLKNALLVTLSMALIGAASVAITYAAVHESFGEASNSFVGDKGINATLTEVNWDGIAGNGDSTGYTSNDPRLGQNIAKSYIPGVAIPKDPKVNNTSSEAISEYVGIKASYTANAVPSTGSSTVEYTYYTKTQFETAIAQLCKDATTPGISDNWEANTAGTHFYYKNEVAQGSASTPVFTHVKVNAFTKGTDTNANYYVLKTYSSASDTTGSDVYIKDLPQFKIQLTGYAISADGNDTTQTNDWSDVKAALDALMA